MNFYDVVGRMVIGSRLRRLSETLTEDAREIFALYGARFEPRWFPVFYLLSHHRDGLSTTDLAASVGSSHASISQIVKEMTRAGLSITTKSEDDGRVNVIKLTSRAEAMLPRFEEQYADVKEAVEELLAESRNDLWLALVEVEFLLGEKSLFKRVKEKYERRELARVRVVDYAAEHRTAYQRLRSESAGSGLRVTLDDPGAIVRQGGAVLVALENGKPVGSLALEPIGARYFRVGPVRLAAPAAEKGIRRRLMESIVARARQRGAKLLFIDDDTVSDADSLLYRELGFRRAIGPPLTPDDKGGLRFELDLTTRE